MAKNKHRNSVPVEAPEEHGGSFGVGLFVGVVAGSLGMFLFGTPQGRDLMQNIKKELEDTPDTQDLPERAQKLLAGVRETLETKMDSVNTAEEFPKFRRKLVE